MSELLKETQISYYQENGFVQVENVISQSELEELRDSMDEVMQLEGGHSIQTSKKESPYYRVLNQKVHTWRDHAGMAKYVFHPRFAQMARKLAGVNAVRFFHDHALLKMPGDSKPTPWHQDLPYWPMNQPGALSIWIALDDVNEHNGCMMFVPKSHKAGKLTGIDLVNPQNIFDYAKGTEADGQKPVIVPLKAGSCTFHNGLTFHYAHSNVTEKPRRALAIIYMPDGTTFNGKNHVVTDGEGLKAGEPIRGRYFPVLT